MKLKTSFFNPALLRKNTIRFSPIWITYLALWIIAMPLLLTMNLSSEYARPDWEDVASMVGDMMTAGGPVVACLYGLVLAAAVFSYLYTARSVSLMHALPIRRSGLFVTNYISGVLFFLVPNAVVALLTALVTLMGGVFCPGLILAWFLGLSAMELFFFSFAVFVAMFTGHILVLPVFYAILNALCLVLYATINVFITPLLYGTTHSSNLADNMVLWLTPVMKLYSSLRTSMQYPETVLPDGTVAYGDQVQAVVVEGGGVLAIYAVAGVVLAVLAYAAYRRHHSETAGDVVSVGWAKVLFRYGVAITAAFTIGQGLYTVLFEYSALSGMAMKLVCMIVVAVVGFVVAQMLLNKSFRVLKKSARGSVICAAALLVIFAGASLDVSGATRRIPAADQVLQVSVRLGAYDYSSAELREAESIEKVLAVHRYALDHKRELQDQENTGWYGDSQLVSNFTVDYKLKNGTWLSRSYSLPLSSAELEQEGSATALLQALVDLPEYRVSDLLGDLYDSQGGVELCGGRLTYEEQDVTQERAFGQADAKTIRNALLEDAAAGRLPKVYLTEYPLDYEENRYINQLEFDYRLGEEGRISDRYCRFELTKEMTSTLAALRELGVLNETVPLITQADYYQQQNLVEEAGQGELSPQDVPTTEVVI